MSQKITQTTMVSLGFVGAIAAASIWFGTTKAEVTSNTKRVNKLELSQDKIVDKIHSNHKEVIEKLGRIEGYIKASGD